MTERKDLAGLANIILNEIVSPGYTTEINNFSPEGYSPPPRARKELESIFGHRVWIKEESFSTWSKSLIGFIEERCAQGAILATLKWGLKYGNFLNNDHLMQDCSDPTTDAIVLSWKECSIILIGLIKNEEIKRGIAQSDTPHLPTKTDQLEIRLRESGFFELDSVLRLVPDNQLKLLDLINSGSPADKIAMVEYLGFIKYLDKECVTGSKRNKKLSEVLGFNQRAVSGNINSFTPNSGDRRRYNAFKELPKVKNIIDELSE